jgi:hypothetical protein
MLCNEIRSVSYYHYCSQRQNKRNIKQKSKDSADSPIRYLPILNMSIDLKID